MKTAAVLVFSGVLVVSTVVYANGFDGTWKTDAESAKLPDRPEVFLLQKGTYTCSSCVPPFSIAADGLPHKVVENPYFDSAAMTIIDANTFRVDHFKAGKVISRGTLRIDPDGQALTDNFSHFSGADTEPVTGYLTARRVEKGSKGSMNLSGAWQITTLSEADIDKTFTLHTADDMLEMTRQSGQSYRASLSGLEAPYNGDPGLTSVRVRRISADEIEETDFRNKNVIAITTMTLLRGGRVLESVRIDKLHGFKTASIAHRQ